jgi:hypothetical protein
VSTPSLTAFHSGGLMLNVKKIYWNIVLPLLLSILFAAAGGSMIQLTQNNILKLMN